MKQEQGLSIGVVSGITGIPRDTLRTWEKRYGFPQPMRTQSRHRVYSPHVIEHLLLIKRALEMGHRTSAVVQQSTQQLLLLLGNQTQVDEQTDTHQALKRQPGQLIEQWLEAITRYDAHLFEKSLRNIWYSEGAINCLDMFLGPFAVRLGEAWANGQIKVAHEHFASERLRDFLTLQWRPMSDRANGPVVVCTTLPDEDHNLGLQMVATTMALSGCKVLFLGPNTPLEDILFTLHHANSPRALLISCALGSNAATVAQQLAILWRERPSTCELVLGGAGAPGLDDSIQPRRFESFESLATWGSRLWVG